MILVELQPQPHMEHVDTHSGVYCCGEATMTHSHLCMKTIDDMVWQEHIYQDSAVRMSYHLGQWHVRKVVHMGYWNTHTHGCSWMLGYCWKQSDGSQHQIHRRQMNTVMVDNVVNRLDYTHLAGVEG